MHPSMDADNRVVLNCGGIRHEVYKVTALLKTLVNPGGVEGGNIPTPPHKNKIFP